MARIGLMPVGIKDVSMKNVPLIPVMHCIDVIDTKGLNLTRCFVRKICFLFPHFIADNFYQICN